jgi:hypothetical protein
VKSANIGIITMEMNSTLLVGSERNDKLITP